ncbi:hypothetical protein VTN02DRAFT_1138 [Thermoascus thermophilus]
MVSVATVIAVSVACSVLFVVTVAVAIVVWLRIRHDRLSLAMAQASQGRYLHDSESPNGDTGELTLERPLPPYGKHPYGSPNEWAPLGSRESVQQPLMAESKMNQQRMTRSLSLRGSLSRSKSKHRLNALQKPVPLSSLASLSESAEPTARAQEEPVSKEKEPTSAVEGVSELPAETTPRATPDKEKGEGMSNESERRPTSTVWPLPGEKNRPSEMAVPGSQSGMLDKPQTRVRTRSITTQSAGAAPQQPMPPPPASCRPLRYLAKDDSVMRLSSMSLETADSSILDDGRKTPTLGDPEFHSPNLPPCPTFNPFSPYDIEIGDGNGGGKLAIGSLSKKQPAQFSLAPSDLQRMNDGRNSPRRSLTTRQTGYTLERSSDMPRRSGSVVSPPPSRRGSPLRTRAQTTTTVPRHNPGALRPNAANPSQTHHQQSHSLDGQQASRLPDADGASSLAQRHTMYESRQTNEDHLVDPAILKAISCSRDATEKSESSLDAGDGPLSTSPLKAAQGTRRGHRRQNCVRISIHPHLSFGGPVFSPTLEEPEESHELEERVEAGPTPQPGSLILTSTRGSPRRHSRQRSTDHTLGDGRGLTTSPGADSHPRSNVSRKRSHTRAKSIGDVLKSEKNKTESDIIITSPGRKLSGTPSSERPVPLLAVPYDPVSPKLSSSSSKASPRRSAVKGPRSQPPKASRNSVANPTAATTATTDASTSPKPSTQRLVPTSVPSNKDLRKSVMVLRRMNSETGSQSLQQYRRMGAAGSESPTMQTMTTLATSKSPSMRSGAAISIWEDASVPASPKSRFNSVEPSSSPNAFNQKSVDSTTDDADDSKSNMTSQVINKTSRQNVMTPKGKAIGLGIGCATPASLYDRDGFLKE